MYPRESELNVTLDCKDTLADCPLDCYIDSRSEDKLKMRHD
jgi:hypothetical protein